MPQASAFGSTWQGSLPDLAHVVQHIQRSRAFGRLSLRNSERMSIAQLYFRAGKFVHIVGNRGNARSILAELQEWQHAFIRFDRGLTTLEVTLNDEHEQLLMDMLNNLHSRGLVVMYQVPRVIEGNLTPTNDVKQLISPWEWRLLIESARRISLAVAHLVGPQEAMSVLQDILDDCSASFPAFASLKISPSGYLQVVDRSHLDRMSREELFEGFTALFAICQHFCSPIIGEKETHKLMIQSLQELGPALARIGVFHIDTRLLSSSNF